MSFATNVAEWKIAVHLLQEIYELGSVDGTSITGLESSLEAAASGDFSKQARDRFREKRTTIARTLNPSSVRRDFQPHLLNLGASAGSAARTNDRQLVRDIQDYMDANNLTIQSRNLTLGTPSAAGGNTGNGTITRCTKDRHDYDIESVWTESKEFKCVADQGNGIKHQEKFELLGDPFKVDAIELGGSGTNGAEGGFLLQAIDARRCSNFLRNASFDTHDASADDTAPTSITGWAASSGSLTNLRMRSNSSYVYRTTQGVTTGWGVEFTTGGDVTLKQTFGASGAANPRFDNIQPYYAAVACKRLASATGTATIGLGSQTEALDISTLSNDTWTLLVLGPGDENWYVNWAEDSQGFTIGVATLATGTFAIDDAILFPFTYLDGTYYAAHGGPTPWKIDDSFTFTDALVGSDSVIQHWNWRGGYESLPHTADATQITAAGGRTLTFNDNGGSNDSVTLSTGDVTSDGYKVGMNLVVAGTSSNDGTYPILAVSATTIEVATASFATEGPLSATATLDATPTYVDP